MELGKFLNEASFKEYKVEKMISNAVVARNQIVRAAPKIAQALKAFEDILEQFDYESRYEAEKALERLYNAHNINDWPNAAKDFVKALRK